MMTKEVIKNNFSRCAKYYDRYSTVQNMCALKLIEGIGKSHFNKILDVGCGTGIYTAILRKSFPFAVIKAVDISKEMIRMAREKIKDDSVEFIVADAETIKLKEDFDLITSNASLQWFDDLGMSLINYKDLLIEGGHIVFSTFGPLTFCELNISLRRLFGERLIINSGSFIEKSQIEEVLKDNFREIGVEERIYKERYGSLLELLEKIKYSGIRGY